jgi:hypothetical protein
MGARGFQTRPDSKRGSVENGGAIPEPIQEPLDPPVWCKGAALKEFHRLVDQNRRAGVPIRQIDADQYAELAEATRRWRVEDDESARFRLFKQMTEYRSGLNMGPRNRQRAGIKDTTKPKTQSATLAIIEKSRKLV